MQDLEKFICVNLEHFIFYPLRLKSLEIPQDKEIRDFLEEKCCTLLNLDKKEEYFLHYCFVDSTYYCLLCPKNALKQYVKSSKDYASHYCFLCASLAKDSKEEQYFLMLDSFKIWCVVGYKNGSLLKLEWFLDFNKMLESLREKRDFILLKTPFLTQDDFKNLNEFSYKTIELDKLQCDEKYNFNPLEKELSLWSSTLGKLIKSFLLGVVLGGILFFILFVLNATKDREIQNLRELKESKINEIKNREKSLSDSELNAIALSEKLENLKAQFSTNAEILKSTNTSFYGLEFFQKYQQFLEENNIKIAYFYADSSEVHLLLFGKNSLEFLSILEQVYKINNFKKYNDFFWIEILTSQGE
ncbi:MAG: hypothetical protein SOW25_06995 [Helicobacter sp.]|nr:hypothetical protein [Helicobacteraceae bacterium]MDY3114055.1 hypothetical protein [Helicobacter sp.]